MSTTATAGAIATTQTISPYINIASLFDYFNYSVVAAFLSTFFYSVVVGFGHLLEISIILILIFICWSIIDPVVRYILKDIWTVAENEKWHETLLGVMNFFTWAMRFLVFQMLLGALTDAWKTGDLNYGESAVLVYTVIILSVAGVHTIKVVSS